MSVFIDRNADRIGSASDWTVFDIRLTFAFGKVQRNYDLFTRFDQQVKTKPQRDGSPEESLLMLGYEPSLIETRPEMSDY